ncbi:MAG TPA: hypothetical protein VGN17_04045 [Bryobacteraceae bacterium]|jgi:hypothetical protein
MNSQDVGADPDELRDNIAESIGRARGLVDDLKSVQEHENNLLNDNEPPPLARGPNP